MHSRALVMWFVRRPSGRPFWGTHCANGVKFGMKNLPVVVTWKHNSQDSNLSPSESQIQRLNQYITRPHKKYWLILSKFDLYGCMSYTIHAHSAVWIANAGKWVSFIRNRCIILFSQKGRQFHNFLSTELFLDQSINLLKAKGLIFWMSG